MAGSQGQPKSRRASLTFDEVGERAARDFAKGELIGLNMKDEIESTTVIGRLRRARGFNNTDFENVVGRVEGAFRRTTK